MRLAVTIDLDGPEEYAAIHGVRLSEHDPGVMYGGPLARFAALCERARVPGTLFVIARDLDGEVSERVRRLCAQGFEVANHSTDHDYRLSRRSRAHIDDDLARSRAIHEAELGEPPAGFRAPGHHLSATLLAALEAAGFAYSSSSLPSPPYFAVKALVLAAYRLVGRSSRAMLGSPRMAVAPRCPYRTSRIPYRRGHQTLVELPVSVATPARLPVTGASLVLAPSGLRRMLIRSLSRQETVVLNLHAMDLIDPAADRLPEVLTTHQPELRIPVATRLEILAAVLAQLTRNHAPVTCSELARTCRAQSHRA